MNEPEALSEWEENFVRMNPTTVSDVYDQTEICKCGEEFLWWQTQAHKSRCKLEGNAND